MGAPSYPWTEELEADFCDRMIAGQSIRAICSAEDMPSIPTVLKHLKESQAFAIQYARAKEIQMEAMAEEILEIADYSERDTIIVKKGDSEHEVPDNEWISRSKLRVDTRKWLMSKMAPKKYGDKLQTELTGADGGEVVIRHIGAK